MLVQMVKRLGDSGTGTGSGSGTKGSPNEVGSLEFTA
jgi:hypothetical protein